MVELSAADPKTQQAAKDASRVVATGRAVVFKGLLDTNLVDADDVGNFGYFKGAPSAETQACMEAFADAVRGGKTFDKGIYYGVNLFARKLDESSLAAAYAGGTGGTGRDGGNRRVFADVVSFLEPSGDAAGADGAVSRGRCQRPAVR